MGPQPLAQAQKLVLWVINEGGALVDSSQKAVFVASQPSPELATQPVRDLFEGRTAASVDDASRVRLGPLRLVPTRPCHSRRLRPMLVHVAATKVVIVDVITSPQPIQGGAVGALGLA
jgi:hypothetical protein